jgi:hypothetical protein
VASEARHGLIFTLPPCEPSPKFSQRPALYVGRKENQRTHCNTTISSANPCSEGVRTMAIRPDPRLCPRCGTTEPSAILVVGGRLRSHPARCHGENPSAPKWRGSVLRLRGRLPEVCRQLFRRSGKQFRRADCVLLSDRPWRTRSRARLA